METNFDDYPPRDDRHRDGWHRDTRRHLSRFVTTGTLSLNGVLVCVATIGVTTLCVVFSESLKMTSYRLYTLYMMYQSVSRRYASRRPASLFRIVTNGVHTLMCALYGAFLGVVTIGIVFSGSCRMSSLCLPVLYKVYWPASRRPVYFSESCPVASLCLSMQGIVYWSASGLFDQRPDDGSHEARRRFSRVMMNDIPKLMCATYAILVFVSMMGVAALGVVFSESCGTASLCVSMLCMLYWSSWRRSA